jgi:hypothetical protein
LRRDKDHGIGHRYDVVLLARARKQVIAGSQLNTTNGDGSGENDNFFGTVVGVPWKS